MNKIQCSICQKEFTIENGLYKEDFLTITKEWGYFSKKDIEKHSFHICETCYDEWTATFMIPVMKEKISEIV